MCPLIRKLISGSVRPLIPSPVQAPSYIARPAPRATLDWMVSATTVAPGQSLVNLSDFATGLLDDQGQANPHNYMEDDAGVGTHSLTIPTTWAGEYALDAIVKPRGRDSFLINCGGAAYGVFDLNANSVITQFGLTSHDIQDLSDGWKFVRIVFTLNATDVSQLCTATSDGSFVIASDPAKGFLMSMFRLSHNP